MELTEKPGKKKCPYCAEDILAEAKKCKYCGEMLDPALREKKWNPGTAAVLSLVIPGAGQIYKGKLSEGLSWLVGVAIGYALFVIPGLVAHIYCIMDAYGKSHQATNKAASASKPGMTWQQFIGVGNKWQEFVALAVLGFILPAFVVAATRGNGDTPPDAFQIAAMLGLPVVLPVVWSFLRPHVLAKGWIEDKAKKAK